MILPERHDIIKANRLLLERTPGFFIPPDNLLHPAKLDWALGAIRCPVFDVDRFPTLTEKAALLTWTIIDGHVFNDGNKRTAMSVLRTMIVVNGFSFRVTSDEIEAMALQVANKQCNRDDLLQWIRAKIAPGYTHTAYTLECRTAQHHC